MSNIFITLDYELYFGSNPGSQSKSIIYPTQRLLKILEKHNVKASFFVDCGYLLKLKKHKIKHASLEADYKELSEQLEYLTSNGHDLQLHIHPHWEDSYYDGEKWVMDTSRYRLNSFSAEEIDSIVTRYKEVLEEFAQNEVFAFRAGGWCIQPFVKLREAFKRNNIWLDSTIFSNGRNNSETHYFNFKNAPSKSFWKFENDPLIEQPDGFFSEIPISSLKVPPSFFWKLAFFKKFGKEQHKNFGDGSAAGGSKWDKLRMLTQPSNTVVSIDGYKASLLEKAFRKSRKTKDKQNFVIIGHPKAMSEYSMLKLDRFLSENLNNDFLTYTSWARDVRKPMLVEKF